MLWAPSFEGLLFRAEDLFFFSSFCLSIFSPGADAGFTNPGGGGDPSIGPRALETLATPLPPGMDSPHIDRPLFSFRLYNVYSLLTGKVHPSERHVGLYTYGYI